MTYRHNTGAEYYSLNIPAAVLIRTSVSACKRSKTELVGCCCSLPERMERVTEATPEIPTSLPKPVALARGGGHLRGYENILAKKKAN